MLRAIREHFARRAYDKATREYLAYQSMPAGEGWSIRMSMALRERLLQREQAVCRLVNPQLYR